MQGQMQIPILPNIWGQIGQNFFIQTNHHNFCLKWPFHRISIIERQNPNAIF